MIFALYIAVGVFYFITVAIFLKMDPPLRRFYLRRWWCVPLLPFFNLAVFFIRVAGIINSIQTDSAWKQRDLSEEREAFSGVIKEDASRPLRALRRVRRMVNRTPGPAGTAEGYGALWYLSVGTLTVLGLGLVLLVAIPLPGTGAWTGALVADVLDIRMRTALPAITLGVVIAGVVVTAMTCGVVGMLG